jgi:hypothetical protein
MTLWVSDCCLTPTQQFFNYVYRGGTSRLLMAAWKFELRIFRLFFVCFFSSHGINFYLWKIDIRMNILLRRYRCFQKCFFPQNVLYKLIVSRLQQNVHSNIDFSQIEIYSMRWKKTHKKKTENPEFKFSSSHSLLTISLYSTFCGKKHFWKHLYRRVDLYILLLIKRIIFRKNSIKLLLFQYIVYNAAP